MELEDLIEQISEETNIAFAPATSGDLDALARLGMPSMIVAFYRKLEPRDCVEVDDVRLWPIQDVVRENTDYVPGSDLVRHGFIVIASTTSGDAYCLDCSVPGDIPVVLMPHDISFGKLSLEGVKKYRKKAANSFEEFLVKFCTRALEKKPSYDNA